MVICLDLNLQHCLDESDYVLSDCLHCWLPTIIKIWLENTFNKGRFVEDKLVALSTALPFRPIVGT